MTVRIYLFPIFLNVSSPKNPSLLLEWKSKLEECERGKHEIQKKISRGMTNLDKLNRQINVKVSYDYF